MPITKGGKGNDIIYGMNEDDTLDGAAGADTMAGEMGNDIYIVDNTGDVVTEREDEGTDLINSSVSYILGDNVENLALIGGAGISGTGNSGNNVLTGSSGANTLDGGAGEDILQGGAGNDILIGGAGNDALYGGDGNDTILYDAADTMANIRGGAGFDILNAGSYDGDLAIDLTGQYIDFENIIGGSGNDVLIGNSLSNRLEGGEGDDVLAGGLGSDILLSGAGNDRIIYDAADAVNNVKGGEGTDTLDAGGFTKNLNINLAKQYTDFENLIGGSGNDMLTGNKLANRLEGGAGKDTLSGGEGADELLGGLGNDSYIVDNVGDIVIEQAGEGNDTILASVDYMLSDNVENLTLTGTGNLKGTGNSQNNKITGNSGANILDGGAGDDTIDGGGGNDTVIYDAADSVVKGGQGIDTLDASAESSNLDINLAQQYTDFENLISGSGDDVLTGSSGANTLDGGAGEDILQGGAGNDILIGGAGNDALYGGDGNDTILYDAADTMANIRGGAGFDILNAGSYDGDLAIDLTGQYIDFENIIGGSGNDVLIGNSLSNRLEGGEGDDVLAGGLGSDILLSGAGNDRIIYDAADAVNNVKGGEGSDTLDAGGFTKNLNINLAKQYTDFENLIGGSGNDVLTGNKLANRLEGGAGKDTLSGGEGADELLGGLGNDSYIVDNVGDIVIEQAGEGNDTILASVDYMLSDNVENLTLTGTGNLKGTGNSQNNKITGNSGANILDGGAGDDTIDGGGGNDTVIYDAADSVVKGGQGIDTLDASAESSNLDINLAQQYTDFENLISGSGDDVLTGSSGANTLDGGAGEDILQGGAGNDILIGGAGNDMLTGGAGADIYVFGVGSGSDTITRDAYNSLDTVKIETGDNDYTPVFTRSENDLILTMTYYDTDNLPQVADTTMLTLQGWYDSNATKITRFNIGDQNFVINNYSSGSGTINGETLNDYIDGGSGDDIINGNAGNDYLVGGLGNDILYGGASNDSIGGDGEIGAGGNDMLYGGAGNDRLWDRYGSNVLDGGDGDDDLVIDGDGINESANTNSLLGGNGNDSLHAWGGSTNTLDGGAGTDTLENYGLHSTLIGGAGNDTYLLAAGTLQNAVNDIVGIDKVRIVRMDGEAANIEDYDYELTDNNLVMTSKANTDVVIIFADWMNHPVSSVQFDGTAMSWQEFTSQVLGAKWQLAGKAKSANFTGTDGIDVLSGGAGNDSLNGGAGEDILQGGAGNDILIGGAGNDALYGGDGNDTIFYDAADTMANIRGGAGFDILNAGSYDGDLAIDLTGQYIDFENIIGGSGNDVLTGNSLSNRLEGGEGNDVLAGGLGFDILLGGAGNDRIIYDAADAVNNVKGGEGSDTLDAGGFTKNLNIDLAKQYTDFENLIGGSGNDVLTGNKLANRLEGGAGNDTLSGGEGADELLGGLGNDSYIVDNVGDIVIEQAGEGNDTILASVDYMLSDNVENLTLTGTGNLKGTGNSKNNTITGNSGANILDGGAGDDVLIGGNGDDIYLVDSPDDVTIEVAGGGTDTVQSSSIYTLGANVEDLILTGSNNLDGYGNELNNILTGNSGNNILDGRSGADKMSGGFGNDTYIVDNTGDFIVEESGGGTDLVQASVTYTLSNYVENLTLLGSGNVDGTGNALDNIINGNAGNNTLNGGVGVDTLIGGDGADILNGGAGVDKLIGGFDDDTYIVDSLDDEIIELSGQGNDTVKASISYILGDNNVENLVLSGWDDSNGTGNSLDNVIEGNYRNNILHGGAGNDFLDGSSGDDILWGDAGGDTLESGIGSDIFAFGTNFGHDTIKDDIFNDSDDVVRFEEFASTDVTISRSNNDLNLTTVDGSIVTLSDWYNKSGSSRVINFQFTDGVKKINGSEWETPFNIEFDYTYAGGFFDDTVKNILDYAASLWERVIMDDFADVASGTPLYIRNPNTGEYETLTSSGSIDDIRIYVGNMELDSGGEVAVGGPSAIFNSTDLYSRWDSTSNFEPWTGSISFDATPSYSDEGGTAEWFFDTSPETSADVATDGAGKLDFLTTAIHEIGHVLGLVKGVNAWDWELNSSGTLFMGYNAKAQNGGQYIPLLDGSHPNGYTDNAPGSTTPFYNNQAPVMSYGLYTDGVRLVPTAIELGMLQDIGYDISYWNRYSSI